MGQKQWSAWHFFALPNSYGIGTFGKEAYDFIDFLIRTKQRYCKFCLLPSTSYGDSPYQSFSAAAGGPYLYRFKDLEKLGYLKSDDFEDISFGTSNTCVDYSALFVNHRRLLNRAFDRFMQMFWWFEKFCHDHAVAWSLCGVHVSKEEFEHKAYWSVKLYQHRNETSLQKKLNWQSVLYHRWLSISSLLNGQG